MDKLFTKDRFYQAGLVVLALAVLGVFIAKGLSESKLRDSADAAARDHQAAIEALKKSHADEGDAIRRETLAVLATALGGLPVPAAEDSPARLHAVIDALVRTDRVTLAVVAGQDFNVVACSNRRFVGKPLAEAVPEDLGKADARGLIRTADGWIVVAKLGAGGSAGTVVVRYDDSK